MLLQVICTLIALQSHSSGIVDQEAPSLQGVGWVHSVEDAKPTIEKGRVNYLFFFQSWCPGCHSHGFPTLVQMKKEFPEVHFIAVQTVFEGFSTNTKERALSEVRSLGLDIPVGHDGAQGKPSPLLRKFRGGGTPWTVIIDKSGIVRFNDFRLTVALGSEILSTLLQEPDYALLPSARGGQDLVGKTVDPPSFGDFDTPLTLFRWWTDTCPHCDASLPAIEALREKYEDRGLAVIGVYHPKPPSKKVTEEEVRSWAKDRNFNGEIEIDGDWSQLQKWWLSTGNRQATSVSFLIDQNGVIRFVHPGPVLFPSEEKQYARQNRDYELLEKAIGALLPSKTKKQTEKDEIITP